MNIIPVIRDLLLKNQKAVIPGFGTFYVKQIPARLNKVTRVLTPPAKSILFDINQKADDGQLAGYLVHRLKQDKEVALEAINKFATESSETLGDKGRMILESLGTLTLQKSGEIDFTPVEELLKRISPVELPNISVPAATAEKSPPPPVKETPAPPAEKTPSAPTRIHVPPPVERIPVPDIQENKFPAPTYGKRSRIRWVPVVILVIIAGMLGTVYFTGNFGTLKNDILTLLGIKHESAEDKIVFGSRAESDPEALSSDTLRNQISRELDEQTSRENALAIAENTGEPTPSVRNNPEEVINKPGEQVQLQATTTEKPYHIIAGSFVELPNAEKLKSSLEKVGLSPVVLPRKGNYYMVTLGSYDTHEEAITAMRRMREALAKELWVMKR